MATTLYTTSTIQAFTIYSESFYYTLTEQQAAAYPLLMGDVWNNAKAILRCELDSAYNSCDIGASVYNGQMCCDRAAQIVSDKKYYFG
jgi:hypothetical protein